MCAPVVNDIPAHPLLCAADDKLCKSLHLNDLLSHIDLVRTILLDKYNYYPIAVPTYKTQKRAFSEFRCSDNKAD